jgi:hypothetical protein
VTYYNLRASSAVGAVAVIVDIASVVVQEVAYALNLANTAEDIGVEFATAAEDHLARTFATEQRVNCLSSPLMKLWIHHLSVVLLFEVLVCYRRWFSSWLL